MPDMLSFWVRWTVPIRSFDLSLYDLETLGILGSRLGSEEYRCGRRLASRSVVAYLGPISRSLLLGQRDG